MCHARSARTSGGFVDWGGFPLLLDCRSGPYRALPTETKVESGTSQSKRETSVDLRNSGLPPEVSLTPQNWCGGTSCITAFAFRTRRSSRRCSNSLSHSLPHTHTNTLSPSFARALCLSLSLCLSRSFVSFGFRVHRVTSLTRNRTTLAPCSRPMPRAL